MKQGSTTNMMMYALFAALSAILSQIIIPIGIVPINMTHLSIFISAGLLGWKGGAISQGVFVLLGAVGAPVFSGMTGGIGIIMGATGGFIWGYIGCAFACGWIIDRFGCKLAVIVPAMITGMAISYTLGIAWYMFVMGVKLPAAIASCMLPFLPGDAVKIALSAVLVRRLRPVLYRGRAAA